MSKLLIAVLLLPIAAVATEKLDVTWRKGPSKADLGQASVDVPSGYAYAGREDTRRVMKYLGNLITDREVGMIVPSGEKKDWFVVFEYDPIGHVSDDERDSIDADALLESLRKGNARANEQKRQQGMPTLDVVGWAVAPHYDAVTHNLEWGLTLHAMQGEQDKGNVVNYDVRLLGREGVMKTTLVISPEEMPTALPAYRKILTTFVFKPGSLYAEYRPGDHLAQIGLGALIGGGAVAVAAKSGLLKYLWKFMVAGAVGLLALIRRIFGSDRAKFGGEPPVT